MNDKRIKSNGKFEFIIKVFVTFLHVKFLATHPVSFEHIKSYSPIRSIHEEMKHS